MRELVGGTVVEIAEQVRAGKVSPREVVEAHLARIEALDTQLRAFRVVRGGRALEEAAALEGRGNLGDLPLAGVPVAVKENVAVAGEPSRLGSIAVPSTPAAADHEVVRRLRAAGAVVVGLTTMPELGVWATTDGEWGVTRNPWDPSRTAGGSSGGSAAAVASAMVPAAQSNDALGSIRVPAACCGLFGLKPGPGLVPGQAGALGWFGLTENGSQTTTVDDSALLLGVMADRPELAEAGEPDGPVRIAVSTKAPLAGVGRDRAYRAVVRGAADVLAKEGHRVAEADPPYDTALALAGLALWAAGTRAGAKGLPPRDLQRRTRRHAAAGRLVRRPGELAERARRRWRRRLAPLFRGHEVLLLPSLAGLPIAARAWGRVGWLRNVRSNTYFAPFAGAWNLAGYPAAAVPFGTHPSGVPLSVQLVSTPGKEALLLSVAKQIERLRPWPRHAPRFRPPGG